MRDNSLSPKVKGTEHPNGDDLSNVQLADGASIIIKRCEDNISNIMDKLDLFCATLGRNISLPKLVILG